MLIVGAIVGGLASSVYVYGYGYPISISESLILFILFAFVLYSALFSETTRGKLYNLVAFAVAVTFSYMLGLIAWQVIGSPIQSLLIWVVGTGILTYAFVHDWDKSPVTRLATPEEITH